MDQLSWLIKDGRVYVADKEWSCGAVLGGGRPCVRFDEEGIWLPIEDLWGNVDCTLKYLLRGKEHISFCLGKKKGRKFPGFRADFF